MDKLQIKKFLSTIGLFFSIQNVVWYLATVMPNVEISGRYISGIESSFLIGAVSFYGLSLLLYNTLSNKKYDTLEPMERN